MLQNKEKQIKIAHEKASMGYITENKEVLMLAKDNGRTVAHIQAEAGWITEDFK